LPTSVEFVYGFYGILLAGGTPVPAYPPAGLQQLATFWETLSRMVGACEAKFVILPEALREILTGGAAESLASAVVVTPEDIWEAERSEIELPDPPAEDDLALVQFSSGSTGDPRGVCLTHRNVLSNMHSFLTRMRGQPDDLCVTWLPLYHDMGLIGTLLGALTSGMPLVLIPPTDFLRRPDLWLRLLGKYAATISVAPQFAYNLCVRKVDPASLAGVDLSRLRILLNGAEPISADGVTSFEKRFRPLGLRPRVVTPCYGLAEGTLAASMQPPGSRLRLVPLPGAKPARNASGRGRSRPEVVSTGPPLEGTEVRIRGARGTWLPARRVGEICVRGPSVCAGHMRGGEIVPATDAAGWLATGDLGFLDAGELFITGRVKDLIIIGGRNFYPQDIEAEASILPGLRPGRVVAFGVTVPGRATEGLVIVAETSDESPASAALTVGRLRQQLLGKFGVAPYDAVLIKRGQVPVTTSGKLRRSATRSTYERGAFRDVVYQIRAESAETVG
jgi:acyl-CoA synthetase (AMP-forming)/AMP-acid ligase II